MTKKLLYIGAAALVLCLALSGCGRNSVPGTVTAVSGGKAYSPLENWIFSYELDGVASDGARKQPKEVADELSPIPCGDDFHIEIDGEPYGEPGYSLYGEKFGEEYYRQTEFTAPPDKGEYILFIELIWGNDKKYSGYQYCFKLSVT